MIRPPPEIFETRRTTVRGHDDDGPSTGVRVLTWGTAAIATGALHLGLYLTLTRSGPEAQLSPPQQPAAVMINLAPIAVSQKSEVDNATEGPVTPDSQEAEIAPQKALPPPDIAPAIPDTPPPPNVTPQAVLPPKPPKTEVKKALPKPVEEKVEKKPVKPVKKQEKKQVAAKAAGGPKSDRNDAATAASAAGSAASEVSRASWQNEVRSKIVRAKRFPPGASGQAGVAVVSVTFGATGSASGVRLVTSSGFPALDAEAVAVLYRAAPYPPPPGGRTVTLTVPLNFNRH